MNTAMSILLVCMVLALYLIYRVGRIIGYCLYRFWRWADNAYAEYMED